MTALFEKDLQILLLRKSSLFSTLSYDESDNCMEFLFTLPCTRKQYVIEKYLFVYGISFVAGVLAIVIIIVSAMVQGMPLDADTIFEAVASELPILVVTGGIMIPLQDK